MQVHRASIGRSPVLLVRWEPRWCGFFGSLAVVLHRCRAPKLHAVPYGVPARGPLASILLHMAIVFFVLNLNPWLPRPWRDFDPVPIAAATSIANPTILYLPAGLPELLDASGAESGREGAPGRGHWYDTKQTIRVSRANAAVLNVVDAPALRLPHAQGLVANLIAISPLAPVPPADFIERRPRTISRQRVDIVPPPPDQDDKLSVRLEFPQPVIAPPLAEIDQTIHNPKLPLPTPEVIPPPAAADRATNLRRTNTGMVTVVPPVPVVHHQLAARLYAPDATVAPPPPEVPHASPLNKSIALPTPEVVPPPPAAPVFARAAKVNADTVAVVPPPPAITGSTLPGRKFAGALPKIQQPESASLRVAAGSGSSVSPQRINAAAHDIIVSANAGKDVGTPSGGPGTLFLSPKGDPSGGIGSSSDAEIGHGAGSAIGKSGSGLGEARTGEGRGADPAARGGSVGLPGYGGTNTVSAEAVRSGITVSGGVVHLSSFGSPSSKPPGPEASTPGDIPAIIIIATGRAGGALDPKLAARGGRVYTVYLPTRIGMAVLQYADPDTGPSFQATLVPPQPLKTEIPSGLEFTRAVVSGILDRLGALRDLRIVQADNPEIAARLVVALQYWRFRPVLRSNNAVEVDAVLGFGVSTK